MLRRIMPRRALGRRPPRDAVHGIVLGACEVTTRVRHRGLIANALRFSPIALDNQATVPYTYRAQGITYKILLNAVYD